MITCTEDVPCWNTVCPTHLISFRCMPIFFSFCFCVWRTMNDFVTAGSVCGGMWSSLLVSIVSALHALSWWFINCRRADTVQLYRVDLHSIRSTDCRNAQVSWTVFSCCWTFCNMQCKEHTTRCTQLRGPWRHQRTHTHILALRANHMSLAVAIIIP